MQRGDRADLDPDDPYIDGAESDVVRDTNAHCYPDAEADPESERVAQADRPAQTACGGDGGR